MDSSHMTEHWLGKSFILHVFSNPFCICNTPLGIYINWFVKKLKIIFNTVLVPAIALASCKLKLLHLGSL